MAIGNDVSLGKNAKIYHPELVNLYGCIIGDETRIGAFVEVQKNAIIGARCKISSHSFICEGVTIEDEVFIGHGVIFTNDVYPRAVNKEGKLQTENDWSLIKTLIKRRAAIGSNTTILPGVTIGEGAMIGAGSMVVKDVPSWTVVVGNPAKLVRKLKVKK